MRALKQVPSAPPLHETFKNLSGGKYDSLKKRYIGGGAFHRTWVKEGRVHKKGKAARPRSEKPKPETVGKITRHAGRHKRNEINSPPPRRLSRSVLRNEVRQKGSQGNQKTGGERKERGVAEYLGVLSTRTHEKRRPGGGGPAARILWLREA